MFLTEQNHLLLAKENVTLICYDVERVNQPNYKEFIQFEYDKGHRFDAKNQNWVLFNECLSLSFSFMTFVIRGKAQENDDYLDENYMFDEI